MELRQIEYFLEVARLGSITSASRVLHITQPALSDAIKKLERELGVSLFSRYGNRIELNENGHYFAERVSAARVMLSEACEGVADAQRRREHTVNCSIEIPLGHFGKLIKGFKERRPDVTLRIGYPWSSFYHDQSIDISLFGSMREIDEGNVVPFGREDYVLIVASDHPLARRSEVALSDARDEQFVMSEPSELRSEAISMCREVGFEPAIVMEQQVYSDVLNLVESGVGCCIGTSCTWLLGQQQDVVALPLTDVHRHRYLYARLPEQGVPSKATWDYLQYLQDYFAGDRSSGTGQKVH